MKNIQVIDGAVNCVYDIFAATDEEFALIFPDGQDIAFVDEVYERVRDDVALNHVFERFGRAAQSKLTRLESTDNCSSNLKKRKGSIQPGATKRQRTQVVTALDKALRGAGCGQWVRKHFVSNPNRSKSKSVATAKQKPSTTISSSHARLRPIRPSQSDI